MRGNGDGRGHTHDDDRPALTAAHLKAEVAKLRTLKAEVRSRADEMEYEVALEKAEKAFGFGKRKFRRWVEEPTDGDAPGSVDEANSLVDSVSAKPELIVDTANLPAAANAVRDLFAAAGGYFEWGGPAKVVSSSDGGLPQIVPFTVDSVVNEVHELRRPVKFVDGQRRGAITLPDRCAKQYLVKKGEWDLPRLAGITTAPLLREDGSIRAAEGYDPQTRLRGVNVPLPDLPERPTEAQARTALHTLRAAFQTFPFADSKRVWKPELKLELVDLGTLRGSTKAHFSPA